MPDEKVEGAGQVPAPNSKEGRKLRWGSEVEPKPPKAIILSIKLDNGAFESSISVPLTEHIDFDKHAARWLALAHTALQHGVEEMRATWNKEGKPVDQHQL